MEANQPEFSTVIEYIAGFPEPAQSLLTDLRATIREAAPDAGETIKYQMPAYTLKGNLVYFAAFKNHIGFYPTASAINAFRAELAGYKTAKGSVQFPIDKPLPLDLISRMVIFRVAENRVKVEAKSKK